MWSLLIGCTPGPGPELVVTEVAALPSGVAAAASGVAVDGDGGTLLASEGGLFGEGQMIADAATIAADGAPQLTDVVALGDGTYAVTVPGFGMRFDPVGGTSTPYFCYEPGFMPVEMTQLTSAVAYDADNDRIYAQPLTYLGGELSSSAIGVWDGAWGGEPIAWVELPEVEFEATGMAYDGGELLLARGALLWRTDGALDALRRYVDLAAATDGERITGMALGADDALTVATEGGRALRLTGWRPAP